MINKKKFRKQIVIGTAQLTTNYGIANLKKKNKKKTIFEFLNHCTSKGFNTFDTAQGYINEKVLGEFIKKKKFKKKIKIISKISSLKLIGKNEKLKFIDNSIKKSIKDLNYDIDTILFHDQRDIEFVIKNFKKIKQIVFNNNINRIGFSIYDLKFYKIIKTNFKKEKIIIQLPYNIFNDEFAKLNYPKNFEIHARSIFLQGFLINKKIKKNIKRKYYLIHKKYFSYIEKHSLDPYQLCLEILKYKKFSKVVIGFDNINQINFLFNKKFANSSLHNHILNLKKNFLGSSFEDPRKWL